MSAHLLPFCATLRGQHRSARHSVPCCPPGRVEGATPPPLSGVAPTLSASMPVAPPATPGMVAIAASAGSPVAVLTTFESQAVFRVMESSEPEMPKGTLLRLRRGLRMVTGGTR